MTAPKWITPVGPILKKVASATGNATNTTLHLDSTSNIKNGLIVGGPGVNPDTKIVKFQQSQRTLPINSIRTDTANSSLAIITYPVQQYAALDTGGTASISGVFTAANSTERTVSSNAYNGTYNVTVSGLASSTLYLPGIPNTTTPVTAVKPTSTAVTGISNNAFVLKDIGKIAVGQYIEFNNAGYTSTTTSYGMTIDYIPMGNVVYGQAYRVQSVNRDTKSITVSDGTNVYPPIQPDLYDVATAYTTGDRCVYREKTYRALSSSTAIIPGTKEPSWQIATTYNVGDRCSYQDKTYEALSSNSGITPGTDPTKWIESGPIWQDITPNTNRYPPTPLMGVYAHDYRLLTASVTTTVNSVTVSKPVYSNGTQRYDFFESVFVEGDIIDVELKTKPIPTGNSSGTGNGVLVKGDIYGINDLVEGSTYTIIELGNADWNDIAKTSNIVYDPIKEFNSSNVVIKENTFTKQYETGRVELPISNIGVANMSVYNQYKIVDLGNTDWNRICNTSNVAYKVGDFIKPKVLTNGKIKSVSEDTLSSNSISLYEVLTYDTVEITDIGKISNTEWNRIAGTTGIIYANGTVFNVVNAPTTEASINITGKEYYQFTLGSNYVIDSLSTITNAQWNIIAGTTSTTYKIGDIIKVREVFNLTYTKAANTISYNFEAGKTYKITSLGKLDSSFTQTELNNIAGTSGITYTVGNNITVVGTPTIRDTVTISSTTTQGVMGKVVLKNTSLNRIKIGSKYKITNLGKLSQSEWNNIAGTIGVTYSIGSYFTARKTVTTENSLNGTGSLIMFKTGYGILYYNLSGAVTGDSYTISNLESYSQGEWNFIANTTGVTYKNGDTITVNKINAEVNTPNKDFVIGERYKIVTASALSRNDWNRIAGTEGIQYHDDDFIIVKQVPETYSIIGTSTTFTYDFLNGANYIITTLGRISQDEWNILAGTSGKIYKVGDIIQVPGTPFTPTTKMSIQGYVNKITVSTTELNIEYATQNDVYEISSLGNMGKQLWNTFAGTTNITYGVGNIVSAVTLLDDGDGTVIEDFKFIKPSDVKINKTYKIEYMGDTDWESLGDNLIPNVTLGVGSIIVIKSTATTTGFLTRVYHPLEMYTDGVTQYSISYLGNTNWNKVSGIAGVTYSVGSVISRVINNSYYGRAQLISQYPEIQVPSQNMTIGHQYKITNVGTTDWNFLSGTSDKKYSIGDVITVKQRESFISVAYTLHNGELPTGTSLVTGGGKAFIKGTLGKVSKLTPYTFTVRASTTVGGVTRYSDRSFTISVIGKGAPTFVTKPGAIGNQHKLDRVNTGPAAPAITNIVVETGGNTFVSILPYNLLSYGINNNTAIYISGVSSMTELNGQIWYAGNVNQSTSKIQLFNGTGSNEYYQTTKTPGSYSPSGTVTTVPVDSVYFESQLEATLPIHANTVSFSIVGGTLPAGLEMNSDGYISGYPLPPLNMYGEPTQKDYRLKIKAETETGSAVGDFVIPLYNQEYLWNITSPGEAFPGRQPVMLNNAPKNQTLDGTDTYFSYYFTGNNIGSSFEATNFQWKMIGYDWNKEDNQYNNESLIFNAYGITDGDVVDQPFESINTPRNGVAKDGWITGRLNTLTGSNANITLKTYPFTTTISVPSADGDSIIFSDKQELSLTITDSLAPRVTWVSPADLGTVIAGHASRLSVVAQFTDNITDGTYRLESGKLPPHLELLSNGDIVGKIVYQPASELLASGDTVYYHFTVSAYSKKYESDGVIATRKFTVGVNIDTDTPYDDLYVSAFLPTTERYQIKELLNKIKSAHTADVYRPQDEYHGIAKDLRYGHAYGVASRNAERFYTTYSQVIKKNHYFKNLVLGNLTTAVARDPLNNIIYEVVYAPILDSMVNPGGVSIAKQITWPNTIRVDGKPVSSVLYPNSLTNMRLELEKYVGEVNEKSRLPLWMTSQQRNGSDTGYVPAWVLCYTLPGKSEEVVETLNTHLAEKGLTMNAFSFSMDRFLVDRTMSYTWGTTELNHWPTIRAQFKADPQSPAPAIYGQNIIVDSLVGLEINQPIQFTSGANIANVRTDNTYYITEINPKFKVAGVGTLQTIKIRSDYYGTSASVITPGEDGNMSITMMPFSSFSSDNAYDTYVIFEQETILK